MCMICVDMIDGVENLSAEGRSRPGHFRGVCTVVTKLFNMVQPNAAFFGAKDGMQCIVIKRLVYHHLSITGHILISSIYPMYEWCWLML